MQYLAFEGNSVKIAWESKMHRNLMELVEHLPWCKWTSMYQLVSSIHHILWVKRLYYGFISFPPSAEGGTITLVSQEIFNRYGSSNREERS